MKKIYLSTILFISGLLSVYGHCTPDARNNIIGASPKNLATVCLGKSINQVIQIAIPNDTTLPFIGTFEFDSILAVIKPSSIPNGLSYQCANGCKFYRTGSKNELSRGCINVSGVPTTASPSGGNVLVLNAKVWISQGGNPSNYSVDYDINMKVLAANDPTCITGLESFDMAEALSIFPNPSKGDAYLKLDLPTATTVQIDVFDVLGNKMGQLYNGNMSQGTNQISMSALPFLDNGMYLVKVQLDSKKGTRTYTERMIIK